MTTKGPMIAVEGLPGPGGPVSLVVGQGESVGLVGAEQAALTRIIRCCGGLDPVVAGRIVVAGVDVGQASRSQLLQLYRGLGYVSVSGGLFANLDVLDNLGLPLRYRGMRHHDARARGREVLVGLGLAELADSRAADLSIEEQKLVAYIRATMTEPMILLAEDPSAHLAPGGREIVAALHAAHAARGGCSIVADDDRDLVVRIGARVVEIGAQRGAA